MITPTSDDRPLDLQSYRALLVDLLESGYSFLTFDECSDDPEPLRVVLLRHDIDFSLEHALPVARVEAELGIHSTYFIQARSPLYNLASQRAQHSLGYLRQSGHRLGLHAGVEPGSDIPGTVLRDAELVRLAGTEDLSQVVSFHRMRQSLEQLTKIEVPIGWRHTYESRYSNSLTYLSDSTGRWRHGWPDQSDAFENRRGMQILTHPLWWVIEGTTPVQKLRSLSLEAPARMITDLEQTAVTFALS